MNASRDFLRALVYDRAWAAGESGAEYVPSRPVSGELAQIPDRKTVAANLNLTLRRHGLTRESVERHYRESPGSYLDGRFQVFLSAGSSGRLVFFLYDRRMWCHYLASFLRAFRLAGVQLRRTDRILFVGSSHPAHTLPRVSAAFPADCARVVGMQEGLERVVAAAVGFRPTLLVGYSSALSMLATMSAEGPHQGLRPRGVLAGTDALMAEDRRRLEAAWGVPPRLFYSTTEAGMLASECAAGRLHLYNRLVYSEIEGETLLVTPRLDTIQRLAGYRLPGRFAFGNPCPRHSGRTLSLLDAGRIVEPFILRDHTDTKRIVHPIVLRSALDPLGVDLLATPRVVAGSLCLTIDRGHRSIAEIRCGILESLARAGVELEAKLLKLEDGTPR